MLYDNNNIHSEIYIGILILAIIFYIVSNLNINNSIAIIITILLSTFLYYYLHDLNKFNLSKKINIQKNDERKETSENLYIIQSFPKKFKFLEKDEEFLELLKNIEFIKKYDPSRFDDIALNLNILMKIYIYILVERYEPELQIQHFIDIRDNITNLLYSLIIIVPNKMKHTYNLDPHEEIHKAIDTFIYKSREMLTTLEKFSKIYKESKYIPDTSVKPYNGIVKYNFP